MLQVQFVCPGFEAGGKFEASLQLRGSPGPQGPCSYLASAKLQIFGTPGNGTLTGASLLQGDVLDELVCVPGQFMCTIDMKPAIQRL